MKKYAKLLFVITLIGAILLTTACGKKPKLPTKTFDFSEIELSINDVTLSNNLTYDECLTNFKIDNIDVYGGEESELSYLIKEQKNILLNNKSIPIQLFYSSECEGFCLYSIKFSNNCKECNIVLNGMKLGEQSLEEFTENVPPACYTPLKEIGDTYVAQISFPYYDALLTFKNNVLDSIEITYNKVVFEPSTKESQGVIIVSKRASDVTTYTQYIFDKENATAYVDTHIENDKIYGKLHINAKCKELESADGKTFELKRTTENPIVDFGDMGEFVYDVYYSTIDILTYRDGNDIGELFLQAEGV